MLGVRSGIRRNQMIYAGLTLLLLLPWQFVQAQLLSLEQAEALAMERDPAIEAVLSRQVALDELGVASGEMPDPMIKFGVMALPTDTFHLGQEPMTQVQVGVIQRFPRGSSRDLRAAQYQERSRGLDEVARDQQLRIRLDVREQYLEVLKQHRLGEINAKAEVVFTDLAEITQDYYATGQVQQQDVLRAAVELARVQERAVRIAEEEQRARARLAAWIGDRAWEDLVQDWPLLDLPRDGDTIKQGLQRHPRILALHQEVVAADTGVELARQAYKPEFSVDLTYGGRGGENMDGSSRADLLSVMVMMDVPLFTGNRQDRQVSANLAQAAALAFDRDDVYRRMRSEIDVHLASWQRQRDRLALYESSLLPDAEFNAQSTFDAYQAAFADMTTLMRARITEFDLQLEYARLKAEAFKSQARLLYLEGK